MEEIKGYHINKIRKGVYGEISKIEEELDELKDAIEQGDVILASVELSDLYGALEGVAEKMGLSMEALKSFSDKTKNSFKSGRRIPINK